MRIPVCKMTQTKNPGHWSGIFYGTWPLDIDMMKSILLAHTLYATLLIFCERYHLIDPEV